MKLTVLAVTKEDSNILTTGGNFNTKIIGDLETYSGKAAGVCYMKDKYFGTNVSDDIKAKTRFEKVAPTGHHSIADHSFISVLFEGIPKITAMILNSVGFYNTSEKSGRYTVMKSESQHGTENELLYYKWLDIFKQLIPEYDSGLSKDTKLVEKLAMENARYMLSVFAPNTTMMYTTSLRMWSYLVDWCKRYIDTADESTDFNVKVKNCIRDLYNELGAVGCYSEHIVDNKERNFNFLAKQVGYSIYYEEPCYNSSYLIKYNTSFVDLAQQQRHRTLDYFMCFDGSFLKYYVPLLLRTTEYEEKWLADLATVSDSYPLATMVEVVETGNISNFMLKCDERLCGRVQLETMETIKENLKEFYYHNINYPSLFMTEQLKRHIRGDKIIMKCGNIKCKETCYWGAKNALTRLI